MWAPVYTYTATTATDTQSTDSTAGATNGFVTVGTEDWSSNHEIYIEEPEEVPAEPGIKLPEFFPLPEIPPSPEGAQRQRHAHGWRHWIYGFI